MSIKDSNLTEYGYHLVVATTQASINATMKKFLDQYEGEEIFFAYEQDFESGKYIQIPGKNLIDEGINPFTIPNGADQTHPTVRKLAEKGIEMGFRCNIGLPNNSSARAMDIVTLDKGKDQVTYRLCFAEFKGFTVRQLGSRAKFTSFSQPSDKAYIFRFNVNINLRTGGQSEFDKLPSSVKEKVKSLCPDTMFSVQQLYLLLNTSALMEAPTIDGLAVGTPPHTVLTTAFLNNYFDILKKKSGDVLLGYSVKPVNPGPSKSALIPTDLTIEVSPHIRGTGDAIETGKYRLYTLNYLVMTNNNRMPAYKQFSWNWVEESEQSDSHGTMSIKRDVLAKFLIDFLQPKLAKICLVPWVSVKAYPFHCEIYWRLDEDKNPPSYQLIPGQNQDVLRFDYSKSDRSSDTFVPNNIYLDLKTTIDSIIRFKGNRIESEMTYEIYMDIWVTGSNAVGSIVKKKIKTSYEIRVDGEGKLLVSVANRDVQDISNPPVADWWGTLITTGGLQGIIDTVRKRVSNQVDNIFDGHESKIASALNNGPSAWVFPGGKTFVFKDASFSDNQDITARVSYVDPT